MRKALLLSILTLSTAMFAQQPINQKFGGPLAQLMDFDSGPVPTCADGSLNFLFAGTISGIFYPSLVTPPAAAVVVNTVGGALKPCGMGESLPPIGQPGHILKFQTGPLTACDGTDSLGDYLTGSTCFGAGGKIALFTTSENHLPECSVTFPCSFKGTTVKTVLTQHVLYDQNQVPNLTYTLAVDAVGMYKDPMIAPKGITVTARYTVDTLDYSTLLLEDGQGWAGGSLRVDVGGPQ